MGKILNWLYGTWIGSLYLEFLLWLDRRNDSVRYLTPGEIATIVRKTQKISDGVNTIKRKVGELTKTKSTAEFRKVLSEVENLMDLAEDDTTSDKAQVMETLRSIYVKKGNQDIVTATDRAKMIDQRIQDTYELHRHIEKRNLMRQIRKLHEIGSKEEALKLQEEFQKKYGRSDRQYR